MKVLTVLILTLALAFRAAPLCFSPIAVESVEAMPKCDGLMADLGKNQGKNGQDPARACTTCLIPPASASFTDAARFLIVVNLFAGPATQLSSGTLKPPVPPPRLASRPLIHQYNGDLS